MNNYLKSYLEVSPLSHALWRACEARSLENIKLQRPILDLGCGFGEFAGVFYNSSIEMGIDNSSVDLEKAKAIRKYKKLILADAKQMPFNNCSFKTVLSVSVIEHISHTKQVLKEVYRVLSEDGLFVFTTPHKNFAKWLFYPRLLRFFGLEKLAQKYEQGINRVFKHYSLYDELEWKRMLIKQGFKIEKIQPNIGENIAMLWDLGLLFAFPSQLTKSIFGRRLLFSPQFRINVLNKIFSSYVNKKVKGRACNLLIVARKSSC